MSTPGGSLLNLGSALLMELCVPALEDRTGGLLAAGTEHDAEGLEPVPSTSIHYADRDCTPDPRQEGGVHRYRPLSPGTPARPPHLPDHLNQSPPSKRLVGEPGSFI